MWRNVRWCCSCGTPNGKFWKVWVPYSPPISGRLNEYWWRQKRAKNYNQVMISYILLQKFITSSIFSIEIPLTFFHIVVQNLQLFAIIFKIKVKKIKQRLTTVVTLLRNKIYTLNESTCLVNNENNLQFLMSRVTWIVCSFSQQKLN